MLLNKMQMITPKFSSWCCQL